MLVPLDDELLNLWNDFYKVVKFIDENRGCLTPCLMKITGDYLMGMMHNTVIIIAPRA